MPNIMKIATGIYAPLCIISMIANAFNFISLIRFVDMYLQLCRGPTTSLVTTTRFDRLFSSSSGELNFVDLGDCQMNWLKE